MQTNKRTYESVLGDQQREALIVLRCFSMVEDKKLPVIWEDAKRHNLFYSPDKYDKLMVAYSKAITETDPDIKEQKIRKLRGRYADDIGITAGATPTRKQMLQAHGRFVYNC